MSDKRTSAYFLSSEKLILAETTVDSVFENPIKCTREERIILLLKAYSNVSNDCEIIKIDKEVPADKLDRYKQYDKKCRVIFIDSIGYKNCFYMSYQFSGKEKGVYYKLKCESLQSQKAKLIQEKKEMRDEIESVRRENKKLREVLEMYADPNNWDNVNYPNMCIIEGDCKEVVHENTECAGGEIARQTLKKLEGENMKDSQI